MPVKSPSIDGFFFEFKKTRNDNYCSKNTFIVETPQLGVLAFWEITPLPKGAMEFSFEVESPQLGVNRIG